MCVPQQGLGLQGGHQRVVGAPPPGEPAAAAQAGAGAGAEPDDRSALTGLTQHYVMGRLGALVAVIQCHGEVMLCCQRGGTGPMHVCVCVSVAEALVAPGAAAAACIGAWIRLTASPRQHANPHISVTSQHVCPVPRLLLSVPPLPRCPRRPPLVSTCPLAASWCVARRTSCLLRAW